ncbi:MAG: ABC transporter permease [Saccharolobus sp.]
MSFWPVIAVATRTIKESYRVRVALFFNFFWVIMWYFLLVYVTGNVSSLPGLMQGSAKAQIALSMVIFGFMTTGFSSIASFVAADRESGLYFKLLSTPLKPWQDLVGRTLGILLQNILLTVAVLIIAVATGATFIVNSLFVLPQIFIIIFFVTIFSFGIGYFIASFICRVYTASVVGSGLVVILSFLTGILVPVSSLPEVLRPLTSFPTTVAVNILKDLLINGREVLNVQQLFYVSASSILLYIAGIIIFYYMVIHLGAEYR